jgi:ABC-type polysaccharide/polyol phosphate transport system ATPase subunit
VGDMVFKKKSEVAMENLFKSASCQIIVTHDLDFVLNHCNRAIYMEKGKIKLAGTPQQVVECYTFDHQASKPHKSE